MVILRGQFVALAALVEHVPMLSPSDRQKRRG
jgi:hypothetical protein